MSRRDARITAGWRRAAPWIGCLPWLIPAAIIAALVMQIFAIVILEIPGNDEIELLHVSHAMAHGARLWVDIFEHHSPLYLWVNSRLLNSDAVLYVLYAKLFQLSIYLLGACLFARACSLWMAVDEARKWPFLLLAVIVYLPLTQPVDFAVPRPECYAFAALFAGCIIGHQAAMAPRAWLSWLLSAFCLGLATAFSPRALPLSAIVGLAILWRARGSRSRITALMMFALSGIAMALINIAIAPPFGFYLWLVDFNGHILPIHRELPFAAYASINVAELSLVVTGALVLLRLAARRSAGLSTKILAGIGPDLERMLYISQGVIVLAWCYLFADHLWGRQGVGGIVVVSAFYVCLLIAIAFRLYRKWLAPCVAWLDEHAFAQVSKPPRQPRARPLGVRYWARFGGIVCALLACAAGIKFATASLGRSHIQDLPGVMQIAVGHILDIPPILRGNLASYPWWLGYLLLPAGLVLLFALLRALGSLSHWRRGLVASLAIRLQFIFLAMAISGVLTAIPQQLWTHAPSGSAAIAFSAAAAAGAVWPATRKVLWSLALFVGISQIAMIAYSPGAVAEAAFAGVLVALVLRRWFAARRLVFFVTSEGRIATIPGPSWRRISAITNYLQNLPASRPDNGHSEAVRKILATAFLAPLALGLVFLLNTQYTIVRELRFQTPENYFQYLETALSEKSYRLRSLDDLPPMTSNRNLAEWLLWSRRYCELFKGETVALVPTDHPPCLKDASFYWYIGYYIRTMQKAHVPFTPQPPFRLTEDLRKARPAIIDTTFLNTNLELGALDGLLARDYVPVKTADGVLWAYVRRDWAAAHVAPH